MREKRLDLTTATKNQLLQIALYEDCSLDLKYAACRELQRRGKSHNPDTFDNYTPREERYIANLYLHGYLISDIAYRFGRSKNAIKTKLRKMHKKGLPYRSCTRWSKSGRVPGRR